MLQGLELLKFNHAGAMVLKNGEKVNYGVIRIDNEKLVYYTGKGLREIWKPDMTEKEKIKANELKSIHNESDGELKLIKSGHIAIIYLSEIERVIF